MLVMHDPSPSLLVELPERTYPIHIGCGILSTVGSLIAARMKSRRAIVVTDANVGPLYATRLLDSLRSVGMVADVITVPSGEGSKSLGQAAGIYDFLAKHKHERSEPLIALGGGMIGDLTGFVAATWMRGVPFVQCPTSLEADIDASVGGKTAVNHESGKNLIGAFHQPSMVCIDVVCLATLNVRDYRAALAESVKHGIISGSAFLEWQENHANEILALEEPNVLELVRRNCEVKAAIVAADERENDAAKVGRAALNLGHTVGHAIESQVGYALRHGEAVALGLVVAMDLAVKRLGFPEPDRLRCEQLLSKFGLAIRSAIPLSKSDLLDRIKMDKKVQGGVVRLVLPQSLGEIEWAKSISEEDLHESLQRIHETAL